MPSKSRKQHNFFEKVKHDPSFAAEVGVKPGVANEFLAADIASGKYTSRARKAPRSAHGRRRNPNP